MKDAVALYTDGGCLQKNPSDIGVTWAWCAVNAQSQRIKFDSGFVPTIENIVFSNNLAEFMAATKALEQVDEGWSGYFYCDNEVTLGRLFFGWSVDKLPSSVAKRGLNAVARLGQITPILVAGHPNKKELIAGVGKNGNPTSVHNCFVDALCNEQAKKKLIELGKY